MTASLSHEVCVLCNCDDIENCRMERYVADVRTLLNLYANPPGPPPAPLIDISTVLKEGGR